MNSNLVSVTAAQAQVPALVAAASERAGMRFSSPADKVARPARGAARAQQT
jgi:hypothetical protein